MNITVVCDVLGQENNGTTIAAMNLIRSLRRKGHTVRVVCPDEQRRGQEGFFIVPTFNFGPLNGYVQKNGVSLAKPTEKIVKEAILPADAVHIMTPFFLGCAAARIAHALKKPISAGFHCQAENFTNHIFLMNSGRANRKTYEFFYRHLYRYCDAIHYPTQFICDTFEAVVGPTPHYIISNGVGARFVPKKVQKPMIFADKFVILFTGRYSKEKSHPILIQGVAASKYKKDIQLIFAGAGPQKEHLEALAEKVGINMPVFQFFDREALVNVINYADLYVHPAEIEIEAISCLEAISCGKVPLISNSERSATRYFALDENNLFTCNDSADLAKKIDWWIEHEDERVRCAAAYRDYAKRFSFESCMDKMEQMLYEITQKKKDDLL